ncbi:HvfC family peptide modification chaperone [Enhygromyxa salina]|uniref:NGO1945-like C-terminal domain-containing protein n=1 Tax=Enhygromyxa salina TaxID=215803 RepID=A0A2S9Y664_9BACT|nr:hypothetical protein [Enhygromyxa salina]PRQ00588.1 hypothetical protein ENSA7_60830 [Enhygromyxa salina]
MSVEPDQIRSALGQVVRDRARHDRVVADPHAELTALGLDEAARAGMLACGSQRLLAYHHMVHGRLFKTVRGFLGGAAGRLGDDRLRADLDAWIADPGPQTVYLRDIPAQFLSWARPGWDADPSLPPWLGELAAHQVSIRTIRNDPREVGPQTEVGIELERPIACNATVELVRYRWAVHRLPTKLGPDAEPEPTPEGQAVIAYRHADDQPRFVDIKPRSAHMLELLIAGKTLREALFGACEATGETLDDEILGVTAVTLADLIDRHVLLGGLA